MGGSEAQDPQTIGDMVPNTSPPIEVEFVSGSLIPL